MVKGQRSTVWKKMFYITSTQNLKILHICSSFFIIVKTWKQPRCSSVGEWINSYTYRQWSIFQHYKEMSYQAGMQEIYIHTTIWMKPVWKDTSCGISTILPTGKDKKKDMVEKKTTTTRSIVAKGCRERWSRFSRGILRQ